MLAVAIAIALCVHILAALALMTGLFVQLMRSDPMHVEVYCRRSRGVAMCLPISSALLYAWLVCL